MTPTKILSLFLSFCLIFEQAGFAQTIDLSHYFAHGSIQNIPQTDKFRPLHLRYISYDSQANDFKLLLDKGDFFNQQTPKLSNSPNSSTPKLEEATQELMKYFFIGLSLPNEKFWVNLRPDSPDNILDPDLEKTDIGRIFLEADLQLKKDTSSMTSPQNPEGREYWDKLYKKAGELFGSENITIPTITRPWIVPSEIIIREAPDNAYIYKATLKVMLEEDYLNSRQSPVSGPGSWSLSSDSYLTADRRPQTGDYINDPRLKELNEYSTQLIKETIIPKLTYAVNTAKRYAPLRQLYYSLILAQWFKQKYGSPGSIRAPGTSAPVNSYIDLIDSGNLANLISKEPYDKQAYFQQYQKSFQAGEYNLQEPVYTPMGQSIRRYTSGGGRFEDLLNPQTTTFIAGSSESPLLGKRNNFFKKIILSGLLGVSVGASVYLTGMPSVNSGELTGKVHNYSVEHMENQDEMGAGNVSDKPMPYTITNAENKSENEIMNFIRLNMPSDLKELDEMIERNLKNLKLQEKNATVWRNIFNSFIEIIGRRENQLREAGLKLLQERDNLIKEKYHYKKLSGREFYLVPIHGLKDVGVNYKICNSLIYVDADFADNVDKVLIKKIMLEEEEKDKHRQKNYWVKTVAGIIGIISVIVVAPLVFLRNIVKRYRRERNNIRALKELLYHKSVYSIDILSGNFIFAIKRLDGKFAGTVWALDRMNNELTLAQFNQNNAIQAMQGRLFIDNDYLRECIIKFSSKSLLDKDGRKVLSALRKQLKNVSSEERFLLSLAFTKIISRRDYAKNTSLKDMFLQILREDFPYSLYVIVMQELKVITDTSAEGSFYEYLSDHSNPQELVSRYDNKLHELVLLMANVAQFKNDVFLMKISDLLDFLISNRQDHIHKLLAEYNVDEISILKNLVLKTYFVHQKKIFSERRDQTVINKKIVLLLDIFQELIKLGHVDTELAEVFIMNAHISRYGQHICSAFLELLSPKDMERLKSDNIPGVGDVMTAMDIKYIPRKDVVSIKVRNDEFLSSDRLSIIELSRTMDTQKPEDNSGIHFKSKTNNQNSVNNKDDLAVLFHIPDKAIEETNPLFLKYISDFKQFFSSHLGKVVGLGNVYDWVESFIKELDATGRGLSTYGGFGVDPDKEQIKENCHRLIEVLDHNFRLRRFSPLDYSDSLAKKWELLKAVDKVAREMLGPAPDEEIKRENPKYTIFHYGMGQIALRMLKTKERDKQMVALEYFLKEDFDSKSVYPVLKDVIDQDLNKAESWWYALLKKMIEARAQSGGKEEIKLIVNTFNPTLSTFAEQVSNFMDKYDMGLFIPVVFEGLIDDKIKDTLGDVLKAIVSDRNSYDKFLLWLASQPGIFAKNLDDILKAINPPLVPYSKSAVKIFALTEFTKVNGSGFPIAPIMNGDFNEVFFKSRDDMSDFTRNLLKDIKIEPGLKKEFIKFYFNKKPITQEQWKILLEEFLGIPGTELSFSIAEILANNFSKISSDFYLSEELKQARNLVSSGEIDINNPLHILSNYINLKVQLRQSIVQRDINYRDFYQKLSRNLNKEDGLLQKDDSLPGELINNIHGIVYEAFIVREKILELSDRARRLGREVVVIGNLSYGGVALAPITEERNGAGKTFIVGTDIPVWYAKVGSTESHNDELVLPNNLFSPEQIKTLAENNPFVVIVDGSTSVADRGRTSAHIPDAFKGYRNFFMLLNQALYNSIKAEDFYEDDEFVKGLLESHSAKELIKQIQGFAINPHALNPYIFRFWYERNPDAESGREEFLYLRVNKKKDAIAPKVEISDIESPVCIFMQSAIHPQDVPQYIKKDFMGDVEYTPAYFDDKGHFKEFNLDYEEGYGVVLSKRCVYLARRIFKDFIKKQGKELALRANAQPKLYPVKTIVLDLDGTLANVDAILDSNTARLINNLIEGGTKIVIITEDIERKVDKRLRGLKKCENLAIFSDGGTNGYSFNSMGDKFHFDDYNVKSRINDTIRSEILEIISKNFDNDLWTKDDRSERISPDYRIDLRNVSQRSKFIIRLQELLKEAQIRVKIYKTGETSVKIVLQHKEDALSFFVKDSKKIPSEILIVADSARSYGIDRGLLTVLHEGISVNVGKFSPTIAKENPNIVQYDRGGIDTTLKLLSNVNVFGGLFENLIVPSSRGIPWDKDLRYAKELSPSTLLREQDRIHSAGSAVENNGIASSGMDNKGGIAFNSLPIQTESVASSALGALPDARAFMGDLDAEWARIQDVFNAGIRPSIQRISEYTAAASASPLAEDKIDQVRVMLADILRREEEDEKIRISEPGLKKLLSDLESDTDFENKSIKI